ncbi:MAG: hypothetical protein K1X78_13765 [Verrucomicrobiaceae bacterium]|nr:hypothetical protein [Verrucomicrobiaceae bacterium]
MKNIETKEAVVTIAEIRKQIQELSEAERIELAYWLSAKCDQEVAAKTLLVAQQRLEDLQTGKVKGLTEAEFWAAADARRAAHA